MRFDSNFYDRLGRLRLAMGQKSSMNMAGNRKSIHKGSSAEFSDFREYMPGDDLRRLDWNAYGRLDRLYIKEYMEEKEATVNILIDSSASMDYGEKKKSELALELAAAIAYVALHNMDRVVVYDMQHMERPFSVSGGKKAYPKLLHFLEQIRFENSVDCCNAVLHMRTENPGLTILLSDFLEEAFIDGEENAKKMLRFLQYRKQKAALLQVLAKEELEVSFTGTLNLIDSENEKKVKVTMDRTAIDTYETEMKKFIERLKRVSAKQGVNYVTCSTGVAFDQLLFEELRTIYDI